MRTVRDVIRNLPKPSIAASPAPAYTGECGNGIMLAVEDMKRHMTDEGFQIAQALQSAGYTLCGRRLTIDETGVKKILSETSAGVVVVQDKREWDKARKSFRDKSAHFEQVESLAERSDLFKLTILKDAQHNPPYHKESADEIGCHAWIVYYHPEIVTRLAPYVRKEHIVRTWHTVDRHAIPEYAAHRKGCLLSGAVSSAYPLRTRLVHQKHKLPNVQHITHPGYHNKGCHTPEFLKTLSRFQVSICTSSLYGYALRKIIESTACGCVVITDLPTDEVLPEIEGNLIRVPVNIPVQGLADMLRQCYASYNPERQEFYAERAKAFYDYRTMGKRLAEDIDKLRGDYN